MKINMILRGCAVIVALCAAGCTRTVYQQAETRMADTLRLEHLRVDTVASRDSVFVGMRGDTVVREVYRWRTRSRLRVDTVYRSRIDTVIERRVVPREEEHPAERKQGWWRSLLDGAVWASRVVFLLVLLKLLLPYIRRK